MTKAATKPKALPARDKVIAATFALIAEKGLGKARLSTLARQFKVPLPRFYEEYPSIETILSRFIDQVDAAMLENVGDLETSTKRDIYFDMFMSRFDVLQEHRDGVKRWLTELPKHPTLWSATLKRWDQSLSLMLDVAQDSPLLPVKKIGLAGIYFVTLRSWLEDDTPDMAKTMVSVDKTLGKAGDFVGTFLTRKRA